MSEAYFIDDFARADNADVANGWTFNGDLQIINQTVRQNGASAVDQVKLVRNVSSAGSEIGAEYAVQVIAACDDDTVARAVNLFLRADTAGSDGYLVRMTWETDVLTLRVAKLVGGADTVLGTVVATTYANLSSASFDSVFQSLTARIYDEDESVKIEVKLNDEADPVLSVTDNSYPQFRAKGQFGVIIDDNDVGVAGHIFINSIAIQAISEVQGAYSLQPRYWTFGRILKQAIAESTRDSNSHIDDETFKMWVNAAMQEMYEYAHRPRWGESIFTFKTKAGTQDYELPNNVIYYDDVLHDTAQAGAINVVPPATFRRNVTTTSSGTPYEAYEVGVGPNGGVLLRLYPNPSEARTYTIRVSGTPRYLENDDDTPDVPQSLCQWISWGVVVRYSGRDSDRTHIRHAGQMWSQGLKMARRQSNRSTAAAKHHIGIGLNRGNNDYARSRYGGFGGV